MPLSETSRTALADIRAACQRAAALAPEVGIRDLPTTSLLRGVPNWHPFENDAWKLGEDIRQALQRAPTLKRDTAVQAAIADIVDLVHLKRGRQSFVMALGYKAAAPLADRLVRHIRDPDVAGQVVWSLVKMRASGFRAEVEPLVQDKQPWIRQLAKKYLVLDDAAG